MTAITAADYRGEIVTGKRWRRVYRVTILNPYMGQPTVALDEEQVTEIEGSLSATPTETMTTEVTMDSVIDLVDPETGQSLGQQMTHAQVYVALYSLYRALGAQRDAKE
ncbi:MAG TPA: hypothetical protein VFM48_01895 [Aquabacterium sp.]|nr:hypothetical protein [Aquabacterium sp.]